MEWAKKEKEKKVNVISLSVSVYIYTTDPVCSQLELFGERICKNTSNVEFKFSIWSEKERIRKKIEHFECLEVIRAGSIDTPTKTIKSQETLHSPPLLSLALPSLYSSFPFPDALGLIKQQSGEIGVCISCVCFYSLYSKDEQATTAN
jgi:hypothetical protein